MCVCVCSGCVSEGFSLPTLKQVKSTSTGSLVSMKVHYHKQGLLAVLMLNCGRAEPPKKLQDQIKMGGRVGGEGYEWSEFY